MKKTLLIITIIFIFIFTTFFSAIFYISRETHTDFWYFPNIFIKSLKIKEIPSSLNMMILGLDRRNDWLEKTETTDTIILSHINFTKSKIALISLPRDLWDYPLETKINQIYPKSQEVSPTEKYNYIASSFASISGQSINRVLVLTTENLKQLADLLGGIDLYLENGFIDKKYPNQAYIDNPKSGAPIYKTVEFKSGWVHLDSSNITEFVRSRKSSESSLTGGTDLGRIERQQLLINTIIDKLKNTLTSQPKIVFKLYSFWTSLEHNFSDTEILTYLLKYNFKLKNITLTRIPISSGEDSKSNLLYHPQKFINPQWVFIPQDKEYQALRDYISNSLNSL